MSLMLMLMKPTSSMSGVTYGPGPGEPHPRADTLAARRRCRAACARGRSSRTTNSARTIPCVFVLPPRSKWPGFQSRRICAVNAVDDRLEVLLLVRLDPLLGEREALVLPPQVDQEGRQRRQRPAEEPVEERAEEGVEAPLELDDEECRRGRSGSAARCRCRAAAARGRDRDSRSVASARPCAWRPPQAAGSILLRGRRDGNLGSRAAGGAEAGHRPAGAPPRRRRSMPHRCAFHAVDRYRLSGAGYAARRYV